MHLSITQTGFYRAVKKTAANLPKQIKNTLVESRIIRHTIPSTMIVLQSLGALTSANAPKVATNLMTYNKTANLTTALKMAEKSFDKVKTISFEEAAANYTPKNKLTKNSFCIDKNYNGTAEELNYFINQLLSKAKGKIEENPFYGKGESFIKIGQKYNINPTVMVAIGMLESGRGTSVAARTKRNIGGIDVKNQRKNFNSVDDCIEAMAVVLKNRYNENYKTVDQIAHSGRYCSKDVAQQWSKSVMFFLNRM